jgi:uncharacterized protein (DUF697 family)
MENKSTFLNVFEKIEGFAHKLPGALQKPILQEVTPLKELFLLQRPPRFVVTGDPAVGAAGLFNAIFGAPVAPFAESGEAEPPSPFAGWKEFSQSGRGVLRLLDARQAVPGAPLSDITRAALATEPPDVFLFLRGPDALHDERMSADLDQLEQLVEFTSQHHEARPCVLGLVICPNESEPPTEEVENARAQLQLALSARRRLAARMAPTMDVATFMRFRLDGTFDPESDRRRNVHALVKTLVAELPNAAKLEMARLSGAREAQAKIAQTLITSASAVSGALGAQPIPLADLPFLLAVQLSMVAGIIYVSGRELSLKLATEFLGMMGMNIGVGLVCREGARAVARAASKLFLPGLGNAVSGFVAAGGTYAIGRAATAYFIEGVSLPDARALFKREQRPDKGIFHLLDRRRRLPGGSASKPTPNGS